MGFTGVISPRILWSYGPIHLAGGHGGLPFMPGGQTQSYPLVGNKCIFHIYIDIDIDLCTHMNG